MEAPFFVAATRSLSACNMLPDNVVQFCFHPDVHSLQNRCGAIEQTLRCDCQIAPQRFEKSNGAFEKEMRIFRARDAYLSGKRCVSFRQEMRIFWRGDAELCLKRFTALGQKMYSF